MKKLLFLCCVAFPAWGWAQKTTPEAAPAAPDLTASTVPAGAVINFCGQRYAVTPGCTLQSDFELQGPDFQLSWMYIDFGMLKSYPEQFARQFDKKYKQDSERQPLDCFILQKPAKGFLVSYPKATGGMAYELVAYGIANQQPVVVQITLENIPEKTADLPLLARQLVQLTR
ncbi:hypothetical protein [Hymenobacter weizhouensis]|uniref:hypothetical protein n=1 Tax=Hymenobacter sp. YIM 151500-1 TaxID=2987689 RepID=UPI002225E3D8|nr:hypothetical protein [Hymenobacter sp. YIM 151500-1]UYZ63955.1 hypothetical protein OIS53_03710 [Hymenobacter sp. YIM 151500-1]